jgi:hypothetical protein
MDADDAIVLASELPDKGALSSANLLKNDIGIDQARALVSILKEHPTLKSLCGSKGGETQLDMSGKMEGAADAIILAPEIINNGALSVTNVMGNKIGKEQLAKLQGIMHSKPNLVSLCGIADDATEADLSGLVMDADDAAILASELPDKRALSKLIFGGNKVNSWDSEMKPATLEVGMTEANFGNKNLGAGGAFIISAWITHKDKGAILSLNLSSNGLGQLPPGWSAHVDPDSQGIFYAKEATASQWVRPGGIGVIADAIKDMGAMTSLNLASNELGAEGAKTVAEATKVTKYIPAIVLAPFSCPSDFSINCCCCLLLSAGYGGIIAF